MESGGAQYLCNQTRVLKHLGIRNFARSCRLKRFRAIWKLFIRSSSSWQQNRCKWNKKKAINVSQLSISKELFHLKTEKNSVILKLLKTTKRKLIYHSKERKKATPILPIFRFVEREKAAHQLFALFYLSSAAVWHFLISFPFFFFLFIQTFHLIFFLLHLSF